MDEINLSKIPLGKSQQTQRGKPTTEKSLADWVERVPGLVQDGLLIVGRQMHTEAGDIDLLGIDPAGRWVVTVMRSGSIRRETILKAVDYADCIGRMGEDELITSMDNYLKPHHTDTQTLLAAHQIDDEIVFRKRDTVIVVIGTGADQKLEPFAKSSPLKDRPIHLLSFDVVQNDAGESILTREVIEFEVVNASKTAKPKTAPPIKQWPSTPAIERLLRIAVESGIGDDFRLIHEHAIRHGMYPRTYRWSIMYAPPQNKTRCLICLWSKREKGEKTGTVVYIASEAFAEFYPISAQEVVQILGANHWERIAQGKADEFAAKMDILFQKIASYA
ncbi:MAG: hypothetical protein ABI690_31105 [Chloroflexota bacterium]